MTTPEKAKREDFNFTTAVRVSYADIMEPRAFEKKGQKKGDPKYAGTFIIEQDNPDFPKLKAAVIAVLKANAPSGKQLKIGRLTEEQEKAGSHVEVHVPWQDGTKFADAQKAKGKDAEYARGKILLKATSKYPPQLAAIVDKKMVEFSTEEIRPTAKKYFYSGAYIVPSLGLNPYKGDEGKPDGVSLYFNAALFVKHGERLGGRSQNAAETFKGYIGSISDEDPTAGAADELDDEIPF